MAAHEMLVLGAGPCGLAVAKALGEQGIPYVQVEATDHVGGNWAHGVYETAHIISSRKTTEYTDHPMPAHWPDFPSAEQMRLYFEDYAETYGLYDHLRFDTTVERVEYVGDSLWNVTFGDGTTEHFKGVAVCNGHHWKRQFPSWVDQYEGELIHSKDYKRPDQLRGKKVLVLGGGNSGCDVVSEAARVGTEAHWSLRRGYWFMPKTIMGVPTVEMVKPWMPVSVQRAMTRSLLRIVVGDYRDYGLPAPDHQIFEAHPTVSTEVFHYLKHGRVTPKPDISHIDGQTVWFEDGTAETYDLVVCATGFDVAFPFLPEGMVEVEGKIAQLYGGMVTDRHKNLYVVGAYQARYGIGPLIRPQAMLVAHWVRLQDELDVPIGAALKALGITPPTTHLVDPFEALRRMRRGMKADGVLKWQARRMRSGRAGLRARFGLA